ncbi:MAG: sulfide/dihydroorotate dehydrogenase-like FAD/NAD-binding protein [Candidatus Bathyarchaeota archaeon]|nr:sulfide/dihydroorotate dehydrogenase-like FAD/NAD-binding protein [Candidatus Bathyarchaeota archaeon]MDH5733856.1 sulfide/dihydroorotate dehydrogenase-like FAD/NAD-binding protein [Candidatus Bathyarchaeota archaeon]
MQKTECTRVLETANTYKVLAKEDLAPQIKLMTVHAPDIAEKAQPGQFVIIRVDEKGERIPLTLVDWEKEKGTITLIFQEVGVSTRKLSTVAVEDAILNIVGPLGNPSDIRHYGTVAVACGGVATAAAYPIAKALKQSGNKVISIVGARTANLLILEKEMKAVSDELHISTDDGSKGYKGFVRDVLRTLIEEGQSFDIVYAIGPPIMMKTVCEVTRPHGIKTIVSLNPVMVDGMGMCGACRVSVDGKTQFACVDGPEFDGHLVDFNLLIKRLKIYFPDERKADELYQNTEKNRHE